MEVVIMTGSLKDPNHDHLIGCRRGCRSAPEIASAPAVSELPIGGSRRIDRGPADLDSIYMARKLAADIDVCVSCCTTVLQADELIARSWFRKRGCSTGGQYCRYSKETNWEVWTNRIELQRKDDRARDSYVP
ncbi:hypothetical protein T02_992 [Trichinella nativa]|uniref:Uncharacterized protein n=1 Tax=Trichinella nativa TaxID=6335 RepID=A0A0V1L291_9BILA|nr:hypothetical protein T02_992 [Trichinella nativa]